MHFQPAKCKNVRISRKRVSPPRTYSLNGIDLEVVKSEKDLGVMIVNDTSWREHIVTIFAKANRMLGFLMRTCAGLVDSNALLRLYCSLVRSHLCYCSRFMGLGRWLNLVGDAISFCSNTCIYSICTNLEINKINK